MTKKTKTNEGEVPQYYVENSHPTIIPPETFVLVQEEFVRRKSKGGYTSSMSCFSTRIICGDCGSAYGSKVWHAGSKYQRIVWQCNQKFKQKDKCSTPHLYDETIKKLFVEVMNHLIKNKAEIFENYRLLIEKLTNSQDLKEKLKQVDEECSSIEMTVDAFVNENTRIAMDQDEYQRRYNAYAESYDKLRNRHMALSEEIRKRKARKSEIHAFLDILERRDQLLTEFDETLWRLTILEMVVLSNEEVNFRFKDGTEIKWPMKGKYHG